MSKYSNAETAVVLIFAAPMVWFSGFVLNTLWGWFITPVFGLLAPGIWLAMGLCTLIAWLRPSQVRSDPPSLRITESFMGGLVALLIGWLIVHLGGL